MADLGVILACVPNVGDYVEFCNTFPHVLHLYQITRLTKYTNFVGNTFYLNISCMFWPTLEMTWKAETCSKS